MDIFIELPMELQMIVMDRYFEIKHYEKMKDIKDEIPKESYKINKCFTINLSIYNYYFKVFHSLDIHSYKEECIRALHYLYHCNCCSRHQENKPSIDYILEKKELDYPFHNIDTIPDCKCPCRHLSRWIIRGYCENTIVNPILVSLRNLT